MTADKTLLMDAIRQFVPVADTDEVLIDQLFESYDLEPGDFFLQAGEVCRYVGFVKTGLLRYYVLDDGEEHTYDFSPDQTFACNYESFLPQTPSTRYIQAIEPTALWRISYDNLQQLYKTLQHGQQFGRLVAEQLFVITLQKLTSFYSETADERYDSFLRLFPELAERVPQYVVASYVGIKPQSLSRIRAQRAGKHY
ncbi:Crp/Fnr family transcriptional regulator [Spirosoma agri]|uniref:Crp/Fnr family transcriptional regulator n=1 Tax=Spirosoma agri TaxID=1987381 RepID=A0A6M0ICZ9_9BACT|nr:Crp/Fnr family transcriptional regulator [Spirosoma agri]NEU66160.1 Crp/Fnr family transcriptional regulator [Spirosoma agri]